MCDPVTFRLLGPIEAWRGERLLMLGGWRQRSVLAILALHPDHAVAVSDLMDAVWTEEPPVTARQQIHSAISRLRRVLGDLIETSHAGYKLSIPADRIDVFLFETIVAQGRRAVAAGSLELAVDRLNEALGLWKGAALAGLPNLAAVAVGLEEQRLWVLEERIATELRLGRHADLVSELSILVREHPVRERLIGQLMVALHRCGRAVEALELYRRTRQRLADELGLDTGPELRELEASILRGDLRPPGFHAAMVRPAQLPPDISALIGSSDILDVISRLASPGGRSPAPVVVVITGPAGIGKSALAVHGAHLMARHFPDGQLYVDLQGFAAAESALTPTDVLRGFLDALASPRQRIPVTTASMAGLFRSLVAGRRMIIVLDNARDADQLRYLLPGSPACLVIVTSRNQLSGLVAGNTVRFFRLGSLSAAQSRDLLASRLGDRRAADQQAIAEIADACSGLPLALVQVAVRAATHPEFPLAALVGELRDKEHRLDALSRTDQTASVPNVRASFSWSYRLLGDAAAGLFLHLASHPGREISLAAAAALARTTIDQVRPLLAELDEANMVIEEVPGQFRLDDLMHAYAAEIANRAESYSNDFPSQIINSTRVGR